MYWQVGSFREWAKSFCLPSQFCGSLASNLFLGLFSRGVWSTLKKIREPKLRRLAGKLLSVVVQSRAPSTVRKYKYAFLRWANWAREAGCVACPAPAVHFALYLVHLGESTGSKAAVNSAINAVAWAHELLGVESVTKEPLVKVTFKGLQRKLAKPVVKKKPVSPSMLKSMAQSMGREPSLSEVRLLAIATLAFAGFLRYDELAKLRYCDIVFNEEHMTLQIQSSKTNQLRQGSQVVIARTGSDTCPVHILQLYFRLGKIQNSSEQKLFRGISKTKHGEKLRATGGISYTRLHELLLNKLEELGWNKSHFSPHSAGGATAAANAKVKDHLFKRHGCWKSESAKDGYVQDSLQQRLLVSQSLGL